MDQYGPHPAAQQEQAAPAGNAHAGIMTHITFKTDAIPKFHGTPGSVNAMQIAVTQSIQRHNGQHLWDAAKLDKEDEGYLPTPDKAEYKDIADSTSTTDTAVRRNGILNAHLYGLIMKAIDETKYDAFRRKLRRAKFNGSGVHCMIELIRMYPMTAKSAVNAAISNMKPEHMAIVNPPQGDETTADAIKTWVVELEQDYIEYHERVKEHPGEKLAVNDIIRAAVDKLTDTCPELKTDQEFSAGVRNILDGKDPSDKETNKQVVLDPDIDENFWQWLVKNTVSKTYTSDSGSVMTTRHTGIREANWQKVGTTQAKMDTKAKIDRPDATWGQHIECRHCKQKGHIQRYCAAKQNGEAKTQQPFPHGNQHQDNQHPPWNPHYRTQGGERGRGGRSRGRSRGGRGGRGTRGRGGGRGSNPDNFRTVPCRFYFNGNGTCKYGDECTYSHQKQYQPHTNPEFKRDAPPPPQKKPKSSSAVFNIEQAAAAAETNAAKIAQQSSAATQLQCLQFLQAAKAESGNIGKIHNPSPTCVQNKIRGKNIKPGVWTRIKQAARSVKNKMFGNKIKPPVLCTDELPAPTQSTGQLTKENNKKKNKRNKNKSRTKLKHGTVDASTQRVYHLGKWVNIKTYLARAKKKNKMNKLRRKANANGFVNVLLSAYQTTPSKPSPACEPTIHEHIAVDDGGASIHTAKSKRGMRNYRTLKRGTFRIKDASGSYTDAIGVGNIHVLLKTTNGPMLCILRNVYHIPGYANVISSKLFRRDNQLSYHAECNASGVYKNKGGAIIKTRAHLDLDWIHGTCIPDNVEVNQGKELIITEDKITLPPTTSMYNENAASVADNINRPLIVQAINKDEYNKLVQNATTEELIMGFLPENEYNATARYCIAAELADRKHYLVSSNNWSQFQYLHALMGHRSCATTALFAKLANIKFKDKITKAYIERQVKSCESCIINKMRKTSTTRHSKPPTRTDLGKDVTPFSHISTDVCGPFQPSSVYHGYRFLVGFRDMHSAHTTVIPIKRLSHVHRATEEYLSYVNNTLRKDVQELHIHRDGVRSPMTGMTIKTDSASY